MRLRIFAAVVAALLAIPLSAGSAWARDYWSHRTPHEDGHLLARGHGYFDYGLAGNPHQWSKFKDERKDGDGAYAEAVFQKWTRFCPPSTNYCYWNWGTTYPVQTDRIGTRDGWQSRHRHTDRRGVKWRDRAKICVDQSWEPDACSSSRLLYP